MGALIAGIYGMNLPNTHESQPEYFTGVVTWIGLSSTILFLVIGFSMRNAGLFGHKLNLTLMASVNSPLKPKNVRTSLGSVSARGGKDK